MPGCGWWPCCNPTQFNLMAADQDGSTLWTYMAPVGVGVVKRIHLAYPYLYVTGERITHYASSRVTPNPPNQNFVVKLDVSGPSPEIVWEFGFKDLPPAYYAVTDTYINSADLPASGQSYLVSAWDGTYLYIGWHHNGGSILKVNSDGELVNRFAIPENPEPPPNTGFYKMKSIIDIAADSATGYIYVSSTLGSHANDYSTNLFKLSSSSGAVQWEKRTPSVRPGRLLSTPTGKLYWGGYGSYPAQNSTNQELITLTSQMIGEKDTSTGDELWSVIGEPKLTRQYINQTIGDIKISTQTGNILFASNGSTKVGEDALAYNILHEYTPTGTYVRSVNPYSPASANRYGWAVQPIAAGGPLALYLSHLNKFSRYGDPPISAPTWEADYDATGSVPEFAGGRTMAGRITGPETSTIYLGGQISTP